MNNTNVKRNYLNANTSLAPIANLNDPVVR
jgi:hypothetical protein